MNLVSFALRRPISLLTTVIAVALVGFLAVDRVSRDIFPDLGVPVLYVAQPYGGMDPAQMEGFIVNYYEYHFLYITGIEHVESKSIQGVGLIKLQFYPGTNMAQATAETVAYVDRARAFMPTGTVTENRITHLAVKTGLTDNGRIEVTAGLSEETPVAASTKGVPPQRTAVQPQMVHENS